MMRMASLGKLKRGSKSMDHHGLEVADQLSPRKLGRASSGQSFISRLTSMGSLKSSKRTKPGSNNVNIVPDSQVAVVVHDLELEMAFKVFDANGDGQICIAELGAVLRSLGGEVSQEELQLIMDDVDTNQDGFICLEEFKAVNGSFGRRPGVGDVGSPREDPIREAFATFDKDGNNLISADELRAVLESLGDKEHTLEDCRRMIRHVDKDGDGFVDYKEFESLLSAKS